MFCYKSLKDTLQQLLLRPGFCEDCDHWKNRAPSDHDILRDVYDGKVWKQFQHVNGIPFLAAPYNYALTINIDWFQPYTHTVSSVGAIYISIMNLPRHKRYKRNNSLLIGIIPGPTEPAHDLNHILEPLVSELKLFWEGVSLKINTPSGTRYEVIRAAILCVACDLPAGRKVCGFMSHNAAQGCSKCGVSFPGVVGTMDFSGFDRSKWPLRENEKHRTLLIMQSCSNS